AGVALRAALGHPRAFARAVMRLPRSGLGEFKNAIARLFRADSASYAAWIQLFDGLSEEDRAAIRSDAAALPRRPKISIVIPVFDTPERYLRDGLESGRGQLYENWELCVADDASTKPHVARVLAEYAKRDPRIKVVTREKNGHIAAASNSALALATGELVA